MANVTVETHRRIVAAIARLKDDLITTRNATTVRNSYLNFEFAIKLLNDCCMGIEDELDQDRIAFMLRNVDWTLHVGIRPGFRGGAAHET